MEAALIETFFNSLKKEGLYSGFICLKGKEYHFSLTRGFEEKEADTPLDRKSSSTKKKTSSKRPPSRSRRPDISLPDQDLSPVDPLPDFGSGMGFQEGLKVRV